jgi:hypothetical protein
MPDGILDGMKMHPNPESQPSAHCLSLATAILKRETSNIQRRSEPRAVAIRLPTYPVGAAFETTCPAIPRHLIRTNPQSADLGLLRIRRMGVESLRAPLSTTLRARSNLRHRITSTPFEGLRAGAPRKLTSCSPPGVHEEWNRF